MDQAGPADSGESSADASYGGVAIAFHWILAAALLATFALGVYMSDLPISPRQLKLFNWHKWAGVTILGLSLLRLAWRLGHRPPPLPPRVLASMRGWQRRAHALVLGAIYALFVAVPLSGWAYSSAAGFPVVFLGVLPLPDWVAVDRPLADSVLKPLHQTLAFSLGALALIHVAAACKHHFVDRDGLLRRMWPLGTAR